MSGATSYKVYWGTTPGVTQSSNEMPETSTNDFGHSGVVGGSCYYYRVSALNSSSKESPLSSEVYICLPDTPPSSPTGLNVVYQESSEHIFVSWLTFCAPVNFEA